MPSITRLFFAALLAFAAIAPAQAEQRQFFGYYPSWPIPHVKRLDEISPVYSHVVVSFALPAFSYDGKSWNGTGLQFLEPPDSIKKQIAALKAKGPHVLLAVGGASFNDWKALAAEAAAPGPITQALQRFIADMGFDGIDIDYEDPAITPAKIAQYRAVITVLRRAAGNGIVTLAAWSSGADCIKPTGLEACGGKLSYLDDGTGRERLLFRSPADFEGISAVNVMAYDSGLQSYDPVKSWQLYRALVPASIPVNMGFETAPEDWGGATLVIEDATRCKMATIKADSFGTPVNKPYSVERSLREGPLTASGTDGAMLWHVVKAAKPVKCGKGKAATPGDIEKAAEKYLGR